MKFSNATQAFEELYKYVMTHGESFADTKAVFNASFSLANPSDKVITTPQRKFNTDYADFEWEWYKSGDRDATEISQRAKIWKQMMIPDTSLVVSNYGHFWKLNNQLERMIKEIKTKKETRRAALVHYDVNELDYYKYDTPCNVVLNFYVRNDQLNLTVFARSIDLVYGFCNDQYAFAKLMEEVSERTGYALGNMHWFITNLHIYPRHYELLNL